MDNISEEKDICVITMDLLNGDRYGSFIRMRLGGVAEVLVELRVLKVKNLETGEVVDVADPAGDYTDDTPAVLH